MADGDEPLIRLVWPGALALMVPVGMRSSFDLALALRERLEHRAEGHAALGRLRHSRSWLFRELYRRNRADTSSIDRQPAESVRVSTAAASSPGALGRSKTHE